jgi:hypothetical protein
MGLSLRLVLSKEVLAVLRGRAAWVHDFDAESRINAVFETLPGASFTLVLLLMFAREEKG